MLAVVYGIQRYHTYHKPLVTICAKPIHTCHTSASATDAHSDPRLQLWDQVPTWRDDGTCWHLSRLPNPKNDIEIELNVRVDGIDLVPGSRRPTVQDNSTDQLSSTQTATPPQWNKELQNLVHTGWPDAIKELPTDFRLYWSFQDELAMESGVLFKGRQVLIPRSMQKKILEQLHQGHQGVEKTHRLALESMYWVNINKDVEWTCNSCKTCQKHQETHRKEPLIPHELPSRPWQFIASNRSSRRPSETEKICS